MPSASVAGPGQGQQVETLEVLSMGGRALVADTSKKLESEDCPGRTQRRCSDLAYIPRQHLNGCNHVHPLIGALRNIAVSRSSRKTVHLQK